MEKLQSLWQGFNPRERLLVGVMLAVAVSLVFVVPYLLLNGAIASVEHDSAAMIAVMRDIESSRVRLAQREAEARAAEARYNVRAPDLGGFLEAKSTEQSIRISSVTNQPEVVSPTFRMRHVRATYSGVALRPTVKLLTNVENATYPVALSRIHLDHFQAGDQYNLEVGLITYDRLAQSVAAPTAATPAAATPNAATPNAATPNAATPNAPAQNGGRAGPASPGRTQ